MRFVNKPILKKCCVPGCGFPHDFSHGDNLDENSIDFPHNLINNEDILSVDRFNHPLWCQIIIISLNFIKIWLIK